jgi:hypothetical protein
MPARPSVVPPGVGGNRARAERSALAFGAVATGLGALVGLAIGGPAIALAVGIFFGAGAGIAGAIAGASAETATDASELEDGRAAATSAGTWRVHDLERALRDRRVYESGLLHATRLAMANELEAVLSGSHRSAQRDADHMEPRP